MTDPQVVHVEDPVEFRGEEEWLVERVLKDEDRIVAS